MMGQQQTMATAGTTTLRRIILALAIAALIAMAMTATAAPAFAKSAASNPNLAEGANVGHARSQLDLGGQSTSEANPSGLQGGKDKEIDETIVATKSKIPT